MKRLCVSWHDDKEGTAGSVNFHSIERVEFLRPNHDLNELHRRLERWREEPAAATEMPEPLARLPLPDLGHVTGISPRAGVGWAALVSLFVVLIAFTLGAAWLLGLSLDPREGGAGWYVIGTV